MTATIHPGFLDAFALIAAIILIFGAVAWFLCKFTPNALAWLFPEPLDDDNDDQAEYRAVSRLDALDFAARDRDFAARLDAEFEQRHRAQAPRRRGQDLPPVESIGDRSLDEIRRDADEWGGPDAA